MNFDGFFINLGSGLGLLSYSSYFYSIKSLLFKGYGWYTIEIGDELVTLYLLSKDS